ncbi:hypothetical protein RRG08_041297 [Elysia crispata]|uniref:Reverse transcriptase domain-containing protein n=1 Tax=Elysia crispata TaxID=231223 RepID=A0AAE1DN35_9GAST|nr:hypothetical protein RRG08_041297 [Elysia crispata]
MFETPFSSLLPHDTGPVALETSHSIITCIWEEEAVPQKTSSTGDLPQHHHLHLGGRGRTSKVPRRYDISLYMSGGIYLFSIAGKILTRIILNRLITSVSETNVPEAQCGFRPNRSTTDMIFAIRQIQEKSREQNKDLYAVFIDLTKAFDTVNREALSTTTWCGTLRGRHSVFFSNGVKQGCVLAPMLFNLFFTCVLNHAIRDIENGVILKYRLDGSLFDLRSLNAKTKTIDRIILEALFTDDCVLMAHPAPALHGMFDNLGKTEVLFQPSLLLIGSPPSITKEETELKTLDDFKHLQRRLPRQKDQLEVLQGNPHQTSLRTLYRKHIEQLERFHTRSLSSILGIRWQDKVTNLEVLDRARSTSIEAMILKTKLRLTGHVIRIEPDRITCQLL